MLIYTHTQGVQLVVYIHTQTAILNNNTKSEKKRGKKGKPWINFLFLLFFFFLVKQNFHVKEMS